MICCSATGKLGKSQLWTGVVVASINIHSQWEDVYHPATYSDFDGYRGRGMATLFSFLFSFFLFFFFKMIAKDEVAIT